MVHDGKVKELVILIYKLFISYCAQGKNRNQQINSSQGQGKMLKNLRHECVVRLLSYHMAS